MRTETGRFVATDANKRFWSRVQVTDNCWLWLGGRASNGYGRFWLNGNTIGAHQAVVILTDGELPVDLVPDHTCRVKWCVRYPGHIELVTPQENSRRWGASITHCPKGHEYTPENTKFGSTGARSCRVCHRAAQTRYHHTKG
jgi:hypothetical protein